MEDQHLPVPKMIVNKFFIIYSLFFFIIISCSKEQSEYEIISGESVGKFKIGERLNDASYSRDELNVILNPKDSLILMIDVFNEKYYTTEVVRIGDHYNKILKIYGKPYTSPKLQKGKNPKKIDYVISKNKELRYEGLTFFISDVDSLVNKIRVFKR